MCQLYLHRINTHEVNSIPCLALSRDMVAARTNSKEDICVSLHQLLVESWRGRSLSDSQHSYNSDVVSVREQVCSSEEVHCGSERSTAGDGGSSDTRTTHRLYLSITRENLDRQWLSESRDLGSLCWLIFGGKSTECGKFKAG